MRAKLLFAIALAICSVRLQADLVCLKADTTYEKRRRNREQYLGAHHSASARPVLSPSVSIGTPTLSSIERIRFVIGV